MSDSRRGRRPPLPAQAAAPENAPVEAVEAAASAISDGDQVPIAQLEGEDTEASVKGARFYLFFYKCECD